MYRYGAGLALLALAAAGCTEDHAGSLPPLVPATSAPSVTPSPAVSPGSAVEAAVRRYFAVLGAAGHSGDTRPLARLLDAACGCRAQLEYVGDEAKAGHRITTTYQVEAVRPHDVAPTTAGAAVTFSAPASKVVDAAGRTVRSLPAARHVGFEMSLRLSGGTWLVVRVVKLGA